MTFDQWTDLSSKHSLCVYVCVCIICGTTYAVCYVSKHTRYKKSKTRDEIIPKRSAKNCHNSSQSNERRKYQRQELMTIVEKSIQQQLPFIGAHTELAIL